MLGVLLIFLSIAACLALLFWVGGVFLQSYLYTMPSQNLFWQAPLAGIVLAGFVSFWCWLIMMSPQAGPTNLPYDTIFRFDPTEKMVDKPVEYLWLVPKVPKKGPDIKYKRFPVRPPAVNSYEYLEDSIGNKHWDHHIAQAIKLEYKNEKLQFDLVKPPAGESQYDYRQFVCTKGGWVLTEYNDGPDGIPTAFRYTLLLINLVLNSVHLALWIVCLWLLTRFFLGHAMLIGFILWLVTTLLLMPILLSYSGGVAQQQRQGPSRVSHFHSFGREPLASASRRLPEARG